MMKLLSCRWFTEVVEDDETTAIDRQLVQELLEAIETGILDDPEDSTELNVSKVKNWIFTNSLYDRYTITIVEEIIQLIDAGAFDFNNYYEESE